MFDFEKLGNQARKLQEKHDVVNLQHVTEMDDLLLEAVNWAMHNSTADELLEFAQCLPSGFFRAELRTMAAIRERESDENS